MRRGDGRSSLTCTYHSDNTGPQKTIRLAKDIHMASKTARTEIIRKRKVTNSGRARKNAANAKGTTPRAAVLFGDEQPTRQEA